MGLEVRKNRTVRLLYHLLKSSGLYSIAKFGMLQNGID
jgi:hypothetical protein